MPSWPTSLPAPAAPGYGVDPADQTLRTDMEVGAARVRRRTRARNDTVEVSWIFSDAQMAVFRAWFDDETLGASGGAGWFTVDLPCGDGGIDSVEARFDGGFKSKLKNGGFCWQVTAKLELRAAALTADQRFAVILGLVVDGVYPSLVLPFSDTKALDSRITFTRSSSATYFDSNGVLRTAAANEARFDHDPATGESLGLLIEEARTNFLTYNRQLDNAAWTKSNATITANAAAGLDGTSSMDKLVESTATGLHSVSQGYTALAATDYTFSVDAKAGERTHLYVFIGGPSGNATFNLAAGTVTATSGVTATIALVRDGIYRCTVTENTEGFTSFNPILLPLNGTGEQSYTGDGVSGLYLDNLQLEAGKFATSRITTTTAAATRAVDVATMTGTNFSSWYNQTAGTFFAEADAADIAFAVPICSANDATLNNRIHLTAYTPTQLTVVTSGSGVVSLDNGNPAPGVSSKYGAAYAANDFAVSLDGAAPATDSSGAPPTVSQLNIGKRPDGVYYLSGHIKRLAYYPQRLTNAQLQAITA